MLSLLMEAHPMREEEKHLQKDWVDARQSWEGYEDQIQLAGWQ